MVEVVILSMVYGSAKGYKTMIVIVKGKRYRTIANMIRDRTRVIRRESKRRLNEKVYGFR